MGSTVLLVGNTAPHEAHPHDPENLAHQQRALDNPDARIEGENEGWGPGRSYLVIPKDVTECNQTRVDYDDDRPIGTFLTDVGQLWKHHSADPASWVVVESADDPQRADLLKALVEAHFKIPVPAAGTETMLVTNVGHDFLSKQANGLTSTAAGAISTTAVAKYMGLSANGTAPASGDTTLTAEIVTAGLTRAAATVAHTDGTSTHTLTITYTAVLADVPVTVHKMGVFDAASSGHLIYESVLSADATLSAAGDTLQITETVTI